MFWMKNTLYGINKRLNITKEKISELEDIAKKVFKTKDKDKRNKK